MVISSQSPIFIGGLFKSGTTLLRAMLGQHSSLASGSETYWFDLDLNYIKSNVSDESVGHWSVERWRKFYGLEKDITDKMIAKSRSATELLNMFMGYYTRSTGKRRWVEKTPGNILHLERIYSTWPEAKVIHIIRDPRDVFASLKQAKKWDTVEVFADLWCQYLGAAEKYKEKSKLDNQRYFEIRYEDLVFRPKILMKKVLHFIGEKWEEIVSEFNGKEDEFHKVLELTGKSSTTLDRLRKPLTQKRVGIWNQIVSQDEINQLHGYVEKKGLLPLMKKIEDYK